MLAQHPGNEVCDSIEDFGGGTQAKWECPIHNVLRIGLDWVVHPGKGAENLDALVCDNGWGGGGGGDE